MAVTGIVRRRSSSRSDSLSPTKPRRQPARPKPPEGAEVKPTGVCPVLRSRLQNIQPKTASKDCSQIEDSVKIIDLVTTPPSESEISDIGKEPERISSVLSTASTGYVLDTRSKTINNILSRIPTSEESFYKKRKPTTLANLVQSLGSGTGSGYGKPLVTSLNKKLTVMRQLPVNLCEMKDTPPIVARGKSPSKIWRNENKESVSSLLKKKAFESVKSRSPDKGATGTLLTSNTVPKMKSPNERIAMVKNAVALKQNRFQSSAYTKRIQHVQSPTRSEKMEKNDFHLYTNRKPISQSSRDKTPPAKKPAAPAAGKAEKKDVSGVKTPRSNSRSRSPSVEKTREKQLSEPFRQIINERVKLQQNKDNTAVGRPTNIYSRSFKPQLEDIKSSFMLLNKTKQDHKRKTNEREKKHIVSVHKPKELNEEYRKQQLQQAKKKFQSKHFFHDQKYDKIEGLNWITWN